MAEKEGLRERGGEGEKSGDSSVWPREGWAFRPAFAPRVGSGQTLRL